MVSGEASVPGVQMRTLSVSARGLSSVQRETSGVSSPSFFFFYKFLFYTGV